MFFCSECQVKIFEAGHVLVAVECFEELALDENSLVSVGEEEVFSTPACPT